MGKLPSHFNIVNKSSNNGGSAVKPNEGDIINGSLDFNGIDKILIEELGTPKHKKEIKSFDENSRSPEKLENSTPNKVFRNSFQQESPQLLEKSELDT